MTVSGPGAAANQLGCDLVRKPVSLRVSKFAFIFDDRGGLGGLGNSGAENIGQDFIFDESLLNRAFQE